jgi:hypothetical protein
MSVGGRRLGIRVWTWVGTLKLVYLCSLLADAYSCLQLCKALLVQPPLCAPSPVRRLRRLNDGDGRRRSEGVWGYRCV